MKGRMVTEKKVRVWTFKDPCDDSGSQLVYRVTMEHLGGEYSHVTYRTEGHPARKFKVRDCAVTWKTLLCAYRGAYNDAMDHFDAWHEMDDLEH